jgi:hypothetical protein
MTWFLDLRAQAVGGGVAQDVAIYEGSVPKAICDLQKFVRNEDVVVATHGFNVNRADGRTALSCWENLLSVPHTTAYLAVLWPGDSAWIPAIDYPIEGNEAIASGNLLATFILKNLSGAASVSFASHSLGARVVLQAIRGICANLRVRNLLLMAGAIDDTCLTDEYRDAAAAVDKISVLASFHDEVLALAFPGGNLLSGIVTRGSPYWHAALGREGPQTTAGTTVQSGWQIPDAWQYGHHNYLPTAAGAAPMPVPETVPDLMAAVPACAPLNGWTAAWSAAILSTRFGCK